MQEGGWLDAFGPNASVQIPTWGVVVRGVPTNVAGMKTSLTPAEISKLADELVAMNPAWSVAGDPARINHIGWLVKPSAAKRFGAVVLEFTSPAVANRVIHGGVLWAHQSLQAVRFNRGGRTKFCRKYQKPRYVYSHCLDKQHTCSYCSGKHPNLGV